MLVFCNAVYKGYARRFRNAYWAWRSVMIETGQMVNGVDRAGDLKRI